MVNLSSVSKRSQHVISSGLAQNLWHDKVLAEFPDAADISSKPANQTWKEIYIFNYLKRKWKEEMEQQYSGVIRSLNSQIEELKDRVTVSHVMHQETQRELFSLKTVGNNNNLTKSQETLFKEICAHKEKTSTDGFIYAVNTRGRPKVYAPISKPEKPSSQAS